MMKSGLEILKVVYQQSQTSLFREERVELATLVKVRNTKTNQEGHLYYEIETDKRDIEYEALYSDSDGLVDCDVSQVDWQDLASFPTDADTKTKRDDEIDEILGNCFDSNIYEA